MPTLQKFSSFKELKESEAKSQTDIESKKRHNSFEKMMRKLMKVVESKKS
jgi:hypothetical protein